MSYLELPTGLATFSKAIISFWFRVPQESIDAATADWHDRSEGNDFNFVGILPLVTFGFQNTFSTHPEDGSGFSSLNYTSLIGVRCGPADSGSETDAHVLQVRIQYNTGGGTSPTDPEGSQSDGDFFVIGGHMLGAWVLGGPVQTASYIDVAAEQWHHVLVSFDMTPGAEMDYTTSSEDLTFPSSCKFWWAFDDENYDGDYLTPYGQMCYPEFGHDPNGIVSAYCTFGPAYGRFAAGNIPASPHPLGIPSSVEHEDYIYAAELAELQFFTGVTIDTSIESNRRAFIDADGKPVDPAKTATEDDPQSGSIEWLGQRPDVLFHGSGNWIAGKNTGPMIDNPDYDPGQPISADNPLQIPDPAFQFTPTGKIVSYTPDPSLYGPQSLGPPPAVRLERRIRVPA